MEPQSCAERVSAIRKALQLSKRETARATRNQKQATTRAATYLTMAVIALMTLWTIIEKGCAISWWKISEKSASYAAATGSGSRELLKIISWARTSSGLKRKSSPHPSSALVKHCCAQKMKGRRSARLYGNTPRQKPNRGRLRNS